MENMRAQIDMGFESEANGNVKLDVEVEKYDGHNARVRSPVRNQVEI